MTDNKCPLCNSLESCFLFETNGYDMQKCSHCDLLYISPYPQSEQQRFEAVANNSHSDITVIGPEQYSLARKAYYEDLFPLVRPAFEGADSLLDIGCGTGHLLQLAKNSGINYCEGIELNSKRAEFARKNTGCQVTELPIEQFHSDRRFDVITLIDVLSHVYSYDKLFEAVKNLLAPGGKFVIKTGQYTAQVQKNSVFDWEVPDHLHFMGMKTPEYLSQKYEMKITGMESVSYADELYTRKRFLTKGRSWKRNAVKTILAFTPFAISTLKARYIKQFGDNCYSIILVMEKLSNYEI